MATPVSQSATKPGDRTPVSVWIAAAAALGFQVVPPILLFALSSAVYSGVNPSLERFERPLSLLILAASGVLSIALGVRATYLLLRFANPIAAAIAIVVCSIPALVGGALYLQALLVFLTAV